MPLATPVLKTKIQTRLLQKMLMYKNDMYDDFKTSFSDAQRKVMDKSFNGDYNNSLDGDLSIEDFSNFMAENLSNNFLTTLAEKLSADLASILSEELDIWVKTGLVNTIVATGTGPGTGIGSMT